MIKNFLKNAERIFLFLGAVAAFTSLIFIFIESKYAIIISLIAVCLSLFIITFAILRVINKYIITVNPNSFDKKSSFVKYRSDDGVNIIFEVYRHLQCKRLIATEFEYNFKWSGTQKPIIKSNLQDVINIVTNNEKSVYDKAILKFKNPLLFNQTTIVHFLAELNDIDNMAKPHVDMRVDAPVDIVHFRIELRHKKNNFNKPAVLKRKLLNSDVPSNYEDIKSIPFDSLSKSYEHHLLRPEIGYCYKIEWEK
jgi:hypothetical protein